MDVLTEKERLALDEVFLYISPRKRAFYNFIPFNSTKKTRFKNFAPMIKIGTNPKNWLKKVLKQPENTKTIKFYSE